MRDAVAGDAFLAATAEPMMRARAALWAEYTRMRALVVQITVHDAVCKRSMAIPGVGPVTALAFKTAVEAPERFTRSRDVGAHFGLMAKREQSGMSIDFDRHISRPGDEEMRTLLYEAASWLLTRSKVWTSLKAWGMKLARHRGHKRAVTAVARKLAVIMHAMWRDGTDFRFAAAPAVQPEASATALVSARRRHAESNGTTRDPPAGGAATGGSDEGGERDILPAVERSKDRWNPRD
ncbi:MAG: transposase [Rhodospirillales bacterium]|nr:transposase [Rhodospirillales bacterium]